MKNLTKKEKELILINIAINQFYKKGMSKTTIASITKEANIGKSTFYEYFRSKEDVINKWFALFCENLSILQDDIDALETNKQKICFLVNYSCGSEYSDDKYISIFVEFWRLAFSQKDEESIRLLQIFYSNFSKQLQIYLKSGIVDGEFKDCDTKKMASSIMALIDGLWIQNMLHTKEQYDLIEHANYAIQVLLKGIQYE